MTEGCESLLKQVVPALVVAGLFLQAPATGALADEDSSASAGRRMFLGELPLQGAIVGHAEPLPSQMVSCANCHLGDAGPRAGAAFAPALNRSMMTELHPRRGGPPSLFSSASFCRMLRTGVDPAYIVLTRRMPRYTLSDGQCLGLWRYLTETGNAHGNE